MKILIVKNERIADSSLMAEEISRQLRSAGIETITAEAYSTFKLERDIGIIIVLGGDGTLIRVAHLYGDCDIPIMGVNMGTVGFLSSIEVEEIESSLDKLIRGGYSLDERMLLEIDVIQASQRLDRYYSLNEVSFKSVRGRILSLEIAIDGQSHATFRGDGIIVATPTGSTAYSLSAGGPVIDPLLEVLLLTPLAAYHLYRRPLVIDAGKEITVHPLADDQTEISVDGQVKCGLKENQYVIVRKAPHKVKLLRFNEDSFFHTVNTKLWRNESD
ncbi:MAG: NAD(+)/NADH kinase [Syntrophomonadaceae bacterium]|nr:NAD(+)/NADH kinase [Syntrophomonadaceae bacterium]